jgi:hypothetical protein
MVKAETARRVIGEEPELMKERGVGRSLEKVLPCGLLTRFQNMNGQRTFHLAPSVNPRRREVFARAD